MRLSPHQKFIGLALALGVGFVVWSVATTRTWYDEVVHTLTARCLAQQGVVGYPGAFPKGDCVPLSPQVTVGPALHVPTALLLHAGGDFWKMARDVTAAFAVGLLCVLAALVFRTQGPGRAGWAMLVVVGSLQFVTFGAQYVGEVPLLFYLLLGLLAQSFALQAGRIRWGPVVLAALAWNAAILTKEYALVPVGWAVFVGFVLAVRARSPWRWVLLVQGMLLPVGLLLWYGVQAGSWAELHAFWGLRQAELPKFFQPELSASLGFLVGKPVILFGTLAVFIKAYFQREAFTQFCAIWHGSGLLFFLLGVGWDRFGLLLLPVSALFLADWLRAAWVKLGAWHVRYRAGKRTALVLVLLVLAWQKTPVVLVKNTVAPPNAGERAVGNALAQAGFTQAFTYDPAVVPFLPPTVTCRLAPLPPRMRTHLRPLVLQSGEVFIAGPYAFTEYPSGWRTQPLRQIWEVFPGQPDKHYALYLSERSSAAPAKL